MTPHDTYEQLALVARFYRIVLGARALTAKSDPEEWTWRQAAEAAGELATYLDERAVFRAAIEAKR